MILNRLKVISLYREINKSIRKFERVDEQNIKIKIKINKKIRRVQKFRRYSKRIIY